MNKVKTSVKISSLIMALLLAFSCFAMAGCGSTKTKTTSSKTGAASTVAATEAATEAAQTTKASAEKFEYNGKTTNIEIDVKDYGTIKVALYDELAPITVENFVGLINKGFYDGLTFHRIIEGFMIQGGDPLGTGTGGSDKNIKGEFSANGVENNLSHTRGVISMARSQLYDSASSQFFIVHEDSTYLDGQYAAFGMVTDGMDVVDKIAKNTPVTDNNGTVAKSKQPVINSIKVVD